MGSLRFGFVTQYSRREGRFHPPPDRYKRGAHDLKKEFAVSDDDYIYDEATGEWRPASEIAAEKAAQSVVHDAAGNVLADGDSVVLIKDLKVKGAGQTLKQGTVIRSIRLTDNPEEIDCRHESIRGLVLRTEFVRKR
ncbi:PhnA protein [Shinella sumterensis]|nr:PhnA protein [Shinella sumterensis]